MVGLMDWWQPLHVAFFLLKCIFILWGLASAVGGNLSVRDATLMALANVLVEGFSMGMGDFISDYGDSCMMKKLRGDQDF